MDARDGEDEARGLTAIRHQLGTTEAAEVVAASGPVARGPQQTGESFAAAGRLLRLCRSRGAESAEMAFSSAGLAQLLVGVLPERLAAYAAEHLRPLWRRPELLQTPAAWLDSGGSRRDVSERLHLHRNSVGYRVATLRRALGHDPLDPAVAPVQAAALLAGKLTGGRP